MTALNGIEPVTSIELLMALAVLETSPPVPAPAFTHSTLTPELVADAKLALRRLASSVSVITCRHNGSNYAMTATSVSALSMDPPSMLVCVNRSTSFHAALNQESAFGINVLAAEQALISKRCSGGASGQARFDVGAWSTDAGPPLLRDAQAMIICRKDNQFQYGTHTIFTGQIVAVTINGPVNPLIYLDGQYMGQTT